MKIDCKRISRIVVMGGSFNPPTIAHLKLMQAALSGIGADLGYFVPVSHAYLKRKMRRADDGRMCLSEDIRFEMLSRLSENDGRIRVSTLEFGTVKARTYDTMVALQTHHKDAELYFVIGEDKMPQLTRWQLGVDCSENFKFAVFDRGDGCARQVLEEMDDERLTADRFAFLPSPQGIGSISSTAVREAFLSGNSVDHLVSPGVAAVMSRLRAEDFAAEIWRFEGEYSFLSNRYKATIELDGFTFKTADVAFWTLSCGCEEGRRIIASARPENAHILAEQFPRVSEWESKRIPIMTRIAREKFRQHSMLAEKLIATASAKLTWTNSIPDMFWGEDRYACVGENNLGKILMKVREELR